MGAFDNKKSLLTPFFGIILQPHQILDPRILATLNDEAIG
ncbi:MAG: hypothetical protein BWY82_01736 [Verrucomicrobia bacterium ADurb.Bin474]|nr:MAG: hypothetical protein BWY82_01736 [Verrucomicrobia bacterium ADurb.Bin474]